MTNLTATPKQTTPPRPTRTIRNLVSSTKSLLTTEVRLPMFTEPAPTDSPVLTGPYDTDELADIAPDPVTVTVSRTPAPGKSAELSHALEDLADMARNAPGFLGVGIFAPGTEDGPWQLVARFANAFYLRQWEESPSRMSALSDIDHLVSEVAVATTTSPETFFAAQAAATDTRPIRQIVADAAWYLPVSVAIVLLVVPHLMHVELFVRLMTTGLIASVFSFFLVRPLRHYVHTHRNRKAPLR